jgi:hypothetical protein
VFPTVFEQFLTEECTPEVVRMLREALEDTSRLRPHFELNRFELTIERETNTLLLVDVLDGAAPVHRIPVTEFVQALTNRQNR